ncbi:MAG: hypothetical protein LBP75_07140 [Planctomycetota bacterium]|jgi:hypothetical protein|nr:hypothetical protein [Planctomycetota bacterium]
MPTLIDEAFSALIPQGAEWLGAKRPAAAFAALRRREPAAAPVECDLSVCRRRELATALTPAMSAVYQKIVAEIRRFNAGPMLFTALEPGQGTTFTAANLARTWNGGDAAERILLVEFFTGGDADPDADQRGEIFIDAQTLERFIAFAPQAKIFHLRAAASKSNLDGCGEVWKRLTATFDRLFFDVSPVGFNPLLPWLSSRVSATALVANHQPDALAVRKFADATAGFMGVILNSVAASSR